MRHSEHAHLLSNIEKLPLPILGSMFPFWNPTGVFLQSVAHVEKDKPSLFVASLQSTSFVVSPAEGEGAPGSSGPVHLGRSGPNVVAKMWPYGPSSSGCVALQTICLRTHCRLHARIRDTFARASACVDEMPWLYLLEMPSLNLLAVA